MLTQLRDQLLTVTSLGAVDGTPNPNFTGEGRLPAVEIRGPRGDSGDDGVTILDGYVVQLVIASPAPESASTVEARDEVLAIHAEIIEALKSHKPDGADEPMRLASYDWIPHEGVLQWQMTYRFRTKRQLCRW